MRDEHLPSAGTRIGTEVDRYITWPGQALAYKMGELIIWDLRAQISAYIDDKPGGMN